MAVRELLFDVIGRGDAKGLAKVGQELEKVGRELDELDRKRAEPEVDVDTRVVLARIRQTEARLEALSRMEASPKVELDTALAEQRLVKLRAQLESMGDETVEVHVDTDRAERNIGEFATRVRRDLDATLRNLPDIEIGADSSDAQRELAAIRAQLGDLRDQTIGVDVDSALALAQIAQLQGRLDALGRGSTDVQVVADTLAASARLAAIQRQVADLDGRRVDIDVDVDRGGRVSRGIATIGSAAFGAFGAVGRLVSGLLSMASAGESAGGGMSVLAGGTSKAAGVAGLLITAAIEGARAIGSLTVGIFKLGAVATVAAVAGAAITAAYGAAATAVAALPGVLALVAAPIGAIVLGLDGVKAAAQTLQPEFDALRARVSALMENALTPAFETLRGIFPTLRGGFEDVADGIGTVAQEMARMLTSAQALDAIGTIFDNVGGAITRMSPALTGIVDTLLQVASRSSLFEALTQTVIRFGDAFERSVTRVVGDGTLDAAFRGLGLVLAELTEGFVSLVENGLRVFAAAAPGIASFLDDLTGFFDRFDWAALGGAVGDVFTGLGEALRGIPQGVIDKLVGAFVQLGDLFRNANFQAAIQDLVGALPYVVAFATGVIEAFARIGQAVTGFVQFMAGVGQAIAASFQLMTGQISFDEFERKLAEAGANMAAGQQKMLDATRSWADGTISEADRAAEGVRSRVSGIFDEARARALELRIDADDSPFRAKLGALVGVLAGIRPVMQIGGDNAPAVAAINAAVAAGNAARSTGSHGANAGPALAAIAASVAAGTAARSTGTHSANNSPAIAAIRAAQAAGNAANSQSRHTVVHNVGAVLGAIAGLNGRNTSSTHTITVRTVNAGGAAGAALGRAAGAYATPTAYAWGGYRWMSAARAEVVPARQPRIIGDRMLGDEAFIPINRSARSREILTLAADRMGFDLVPSAPTFGVSAPAPGPGAGSGASRPSEGWRASGISERKLDELIGLLRAQRPVVVEDRSGDPVETGRAVALSLRLA